MNSEDIIENIIDKVVQLFGYYAVLTFRRRLSLLLVVIRCILWIAEFVGQFRLRVNDRARK